MRKIDKTIRFATTYRDWVNDLEARGEDHPPYNSSQGKYYKDIVMELLRCQNGLCAYTEVQLCPPQYFAENCWANGRYQLTDRSQDGQLDHFDERLKWKAKDGYIHKDWLWENFFMIDSNVNNRKGDKTIDYILKPDNDDYNPFILLEYSLYTHHFIANPELSEEHQERIEKMIHILGLNFPNLVDKRKNMIEKCRLYNINNEREFPTAIAFYNKNQS